MRTTKTTINGRRFRFTWNVLALIAAVSMSAVLAAGCAKKQKSSAVAESGEIIIPVKAATVQRGSVNEYLTFTGTIDAVKRASIAPAVPGKIDKILVAEGMAVSQGQALVRMDSRQLQQAKIKFESVKADYDRMKALRERGSATPQQFDQIQSGFEAAQAGYDQMGESTNLDAPFSGTVIGKYYSEGDMFNSMRPGPDGVPAIVTIARLDEMKIDINVPENDYVKLMVGQSAKIVVGALHDTTFAGKVSMVTPALDMMTRTAKVSIAMNNSSGILKPGMFASVKIITNSRNQVLFVPSIAIVNIDGKEMLFEVPAGTPPYKCQATPKEVSVGLRSQETCEILAGIAEGALVVFENNSALDARTKISVTAIAQ